MTDRELLELAAKAAGRLVPHGNHELLRPNEELHFDGDSYWFWPTGDSWNPLNDDGDALRLAVKLKMVLDTDYNDGAIAGNATISCDYDFPEYGFQEGMRERNPYAATRRAIVRAAAEIGKRMK